MSNIIKQIIILNTIYNTLPIIYATGKLTYDLTSTIFLWSMPKINYCKCLVCENFRIRYKREPHNH